ncbi:MAG: CvpA family protein [Bacteroidetes bacterium]|jgi:uncharacterized membrane protein required for colicin V production|nr:CvpA family protein [Bacteroidota bacterium]
MILDLLLGIWLLMAGLVGARDGTVRKAVSAVMTIVALLFSQVFMRDAADLLVESAGVDPSNAPVLGAIVVFLGIMLLQSLIYRFATGPYKIGGMGDRIGGAIVGTAQGVLFLSSVLFLLAMIGFPSKSLKRDSRIYKGVVNISPQILDQIVTLGPEALQQLQDLSSPESEGVDKKKAVEAARGVRSASNRKIDSLRAAARR